MWTLQTNPSGQPSASSAVFHSNLLVLSVTCASYRLLDVNPEGSVPVIKDNETSEWFVDSAKFVDYLEDKHPEPALGKSTDVPDA